MRARETWPTSMKKKPIVLDTEAVGRVFGSKKNDRTGKYGIRTDNAKVELFGDGNIIQTFRGRRMSWPGRALEIE